MGHALLPPRAARVTGAGHHGVDPVANRLRAPRAVHAGVHVVNQDLHAVTLNKVRPLATQRTLAWTHRFDSCCCH
jgi:hypothetical protein